MIVKYGESKDSISDSCARSRVDDVPINEESKEGSHGGCSNTRLRLPSTSVDIHRAFDRLHALNLRIYARPISCCEKRMRNA
jgi:hypothetical protein